MYLRRLLEVDFFVLFVFHEKWMQILRFYQRMKMRKNMSHSDDHSNLKMTKVPLQNEKYTKKTG